MRVVQREVELFQKMNNEKFKLVQMEDFGFREAFTTIDKFHSGAIQSD